MYYVIQRLNGIKNKSFVSYSVPKFITSPKNKNIIFEFGEKPNVKRKWAHKEEIVLLTQDKVFFANFLKKLKQKEADYLKQIDLQEQKLDTLYKELHKDMNQAFEAMQNNTKAPSSLKKD